MMKPLKSLPILLLPGLMLSGCLTNDEPQADITMPQMQQNTYLSHAKPPQEFGFSIYRVQDGIAYAGSARLHPRHLASKRMLKNNIPVIKIRGRSKRDTMNVLIDFSSPSSWLEFSTSQDFNASFLGMDDEVIPYRGGYNTGGQNAYAGVITQLRMDNLFMENVPFYIRMASGSLGPLTRGIRAPKIDAVLGYDNLRNFEYIQIDLRNNLIMFSSTIPYIPHEDLLMTTAKIINHTGHGLAIEGAIFGQSTPITLDFAGNFYFARGDVKVSTTKQVSLGDIVFRKVPTLVLPSHNAPPRAGRKMLKPYIITICSPKGLVYFERPPE
jgi:hypothetical protein